MKFLSIGHRNCPKCVMLFMEIANMMVPSRQGVSTLVELSQTAYNGFLEGNAMESCSKEHVEGASEWHLDGQLCDEWLNNLERGKFGNELCQSICNLVMLDGRVHFRRFDIGQLTRLQVALSQTLPQRKWFQRFEAALGSLKGKVIREIELSANEKQGRQA